MIISTEPQPHRERNHVQTDKQPDTQAHTWHTYLEGRIQDLGTSSIRNLGIHILSQEWRCDDDPMRENLRSKILSDSVLIHSLTLFVIVKCMTENDTVSGRNNGRWSVKTGGKIKITKWNSGKKPVKNWYNFINPLPEKYKTPGFKLFSHIICIQAVNLRGRGDNVSFLPT